MPSTCKYDRPVYLFGSTTTRTTDSSLLARCCSASFTFTQRIARGYRVTEIKLTGGNQGVKFLDVAPVHPKGPQDGQFAPHEGREPGRLGFPIPTLTRTARPPFVRERMDSSTVSSRPTNSRAKSRPGLPTMEVLDYFRHQ